jgi:hypothetical protein
MAEDIKKDQGQNPGQSGQQPGQPQQQHDDVRSYLIERSHRADLDVASKILQGCKKDVPRQNQSCCSQDISNDYKCSHRAHLLA